MRRARRTRGGKLAKVLFAAARPFYSTSERRVLRQEGLSLWQDTGRVGRKEPCRFDLRSRESSRPHFQSDADLSGIVFREMDAGVLKSLLYFEDC